jgi:hypothetical protein
MIAEIIQLSLTPAFVLVAIASILNFLTARLGRVVDRSRFLQDEHGKTSGTEHDIIVCEIRIVARRIELTNRAILLLVLSGLSTGGTVVVLFVAGLTEMDLNYLAAAAFILSIGLLVAGLLSFLLETREASAALRIPETYLELDRKI